MDEQNAISDQAAIKRGDQGKQAALRGLQMHPRVPISQSFMLEILRIASTIAEPTG